MQVQDHSILEALEEGSTPLDILGVAYGVHLQFKRFHSGAGWVPISMAEDFFRFRFTATEELPQMNLCLEDVGFPLQTLRCISLKR